MGWFNRKERSSEDLSRAASRAKAPPPPLRVPALVATAEVPDVVEPRASSPHREPAALILVSPRTIKTYADVPKFVGLLSAGDRPLIVLDKGERDQVVVLELDGRQAVILHSDAPQTLLDSIKGRLLANNYSVDLRSAASAVILEIYAAGGRSDAVPAAARKSPYMEAAAEWIRYALLHRATDIHLETDGSSGTVRFRVDGEIEAMRTPNGGRYPAKFITACISSLFNNDQVSKSGNDSLYDPEKNLYCMVPYKEIPGHPLKLRFQSLKGNDGPKAVLRLLHVGEEVRTLTFEELGYAPSQIDLWRQAMDTPSGMIAIAGVTGSGKSTTMKSYVELNPHTPWSNVLTIEDPVEYPIRGAHQVPIQRDLANPEESAKRYGEVIAAFMRSDPDIVMVGEIRDRFSANAVQQLAETGHAALGTVHAHLMSGIVPRLVNPEIGMSRDVLAGPNMVTLFAYQALVPLLCPHCRLTSSQVVRDHQVSMILESVARLGLDPQLLRWKRHDGCAECQGRGTLGLTVAAEMMAPDEDWLRQIRAGRDNEAAEVYRSRSDRNFLSPDMTGKTVFEHTLFKALNGLVDARKCSAFDTWQRYMHRFDALRNRPAG